MKVVIECTTLIVEAACLLLVGLEVSRISASWPKKTKVPLGGKVYINYIHTMATEAGSKQLNNM